MQDKLLLNDLLLNNYTIRYDTLQGKEHLIVPVVLMVQGVHRGSHGPILHLADELGKFPGAWDGIPVSVQHPQEDGMHVSANQPHILDEYVVGRVFNTRMDGQKLRAEAWIDPEALGRISAEALEHIRAGKPMDVSVGVFTDEDMQAGDYAGEHYEAVARNHRPDHLALLPGGIGACSWVDGCGVRTHEDSNIYTNGNTCHNPSGPGGGQFCGGGISSGNNTSNKTFNDGMKGVKESDLKKWGGERAEKARMAATLAKATGHGWSGFNLKVGNEVKGVVALTKDSKNIIVEYLATKEKGHGQAMMKEICRRASSEGKGVKLISTESARGFYQRMGMTAGSRIRATGAQHFSFTKQQAQEFSGG